MLGAGLASMGVPKNSILQYETAIKMGKFILIAHGSTKEVSHARAIISGTTAEVFEQHHPALAIPDERSALAKSECAA